MKVINVYRGRKGVSLLSKIFLQRLVFFLFVFGVGRIIIIIEEYGDTDALLLVTLFYFPIVIFLIIRWSFQQIKSVLTLKKEKTKTELLLLKSQVNPHFFFNMLNNLYGLVSADPALAKQLILRLSDMMRYSIYEGGRELVPIEEEVDFLKNFIELHQMRYRKQIDVKFTTTIQQNYNVMPLLYIILLENAFKHGVENLRKNAFVHLQLHAAENTVYFSIVNNYDATALSTSKGIGLDNLKRRLALGYPDKHSLIFTKENNKYKVELTITTL
ncbi:hypothetical protein BSU00_11125 [Tenacibaculum sp. SG-28]|nr:hypothetical protein BSU00_11125 [Tenacibaculum sp. SG-28]